MKIVRIKGKKFVWLTLHIDTMLKELEFELGINFIPGKFGLLFYKPIGGTT